MIMEPQISALNIPLHSLHCHFTVSLRHGAVVWQLAECEVVFIQ